MMMGTIYIYVTHVTGNIILTSHILLRNGENEKSRRPKMKILLPERILVPETKGDVLIEGFVRVVRWKDIKNIYNIKPKKGKRCTDVLGIEICNHYGLRHSAYWPIMYIVDGLQVIRCPVCGRMVKHADTKEAERIWNEQIKAAENAT
jgi:hypothetical protein